VIRGTTTLCAEASGKALTAVALPAAAAGATPDAAAATAAQRESFRSTDKLRVSVLNLVVVRDGPLRRPVQSGGGLIDESLEVNKAGSGRNALPLSHRRLARDTATRDRLERYRWDAEVALNILKIAFSQPGLPRVSGGQVEMDAILDVLALGTVGRDARDAGRAAVVSGPRAYPPSARSR